MPETTTTQAVPSLSHAHTCVAVRANPPKKKNNFKNACQKQPHRPFLRSRMPVRAKKKLSNRMPETTTQAVPLLPRARTCKKKKNLNKKLSNQAEARSQKQQPHRPFLRSHVPVRACPYLRGRTWKKNTLIPLARNNHTGRSFALACPYVRDRACVNVRANQKKNNFQTNTQAVPSLS